VKKNVNEDHIIFYFSMFTMYDYARYAGQQSPLMLTFH